MNDDLKTTYCIIIDIQNIQIEKSIVTERLLVARGAEWGGRMAAEWIWVYFRCDINGQHCEQTKSRWLFHFGMVKVIWGFSSVVEGSFVQWARGRIPGTKERVKTGRQAEREGKKEEGRKGWGCSDVGTCLLYPKPWVWFQDHRNQVWRYTSTIPALKRWRKRNSVVQIILCYTESCRPPWDRWSSVSKWGK